MYSNRAVHHEELKILQQRVSESVKREEVNHMQRCRLTGSPSISTQYTRHNTDHNVHSTLYMDEVLANYACIFKNCNLYFHIQS